MPLLSPMAKKRKVLKPADLPLANSQSANGCPPARSGTLVGGHLCWQVRGTTLRLNVSA